jgi:hypothetical protein
MFFPSFGYQRVVLSEKFAHPSNHASMVLCHCGKSALHAVGKSALHAVWCDHIVYRADQPN